MALRKTSYRVDEDLLGAFRILCKEWGVTPSLVIRQSIKAWVRQGSLAPLFEGPRERKVNGADEL